MELIRKLTANITVVDDLPDYGNDPVFKKHARETIEFLKKHGIPEEWMTPEQKKNGIQFYDHLY